MSKLQLQSEDASLLIGGMDRRFEPIIHSSKWNEAWFALIDTEKVDGKPILTDQTAEVNLANSRSRWYLNEDRTLEFEKILYQRPRKSEWVFPIDFSPGICFNFQPTLTNIEKKTKIRPPEIEESYSVYFNKRHNQYKTGKVGHLKRWTLTDRLGRKVFGDIRIDPIKKFLRFKAPEWFLLQAVYPVTIGPTIGYTALGASLDNTNDYLLAQRFTPPSNGDANTGTFHFGGAKGSAGSITVVGGSYLDVVNTPAGTAKKNSSDASMTVNSTTNQFWTSSVTWTTILAAANYWLSINNANDGQSAYDSSSNTIHFAARTHAGSMPATWPTSDGTFTGDLSVYIDYTASGGATRPVKMAGEWLGYAGIGGGFAG